MLIFGVANLLHLSLHVLIKPAACGLILSFLAEIIECNHYHDFPWDTIHHFSPLTSGSLRENHQI